MKKIVTIAILFGALIVNAQEKKKNQKKVGKKEGTFPFYSISLHLIIG